MSELYKMCGGCHKSLPITEFWKNKNSSDGLQAYCKSCGKAKTKEHRLMHPELHREISKRSWTKNREKRIAGDELRAGDRKLFIDSLKTPCVKCGENRIYLLQFHHVNPNEKVFTISCGSKYHKSKEDVAAEIKKCVCLCANCHKEFHYFYGLRPKSPVEDLHNYIKGGVAVGYTV